MLVAMALSSCGSSPNVTFFALSTTPGAARPAALHAIRLRRPSLPAYLDRPEIVRSVVDHRLAVTANERWGAPLDEMVGRVLAADVELRLRGSSVYTEDGAITADPDATVEVNVQRFDVDEGGALVLVAEVALERGAAHGEAASRAVRVTARPVAHSTEALVATASDLLGQLADQIAALLVGG
jgi:hypothetical protein